jgi:hypothetical protein
VAVVMSFDDSIERVVDEILADDEEELSEDITLGSSESELSSYESAYDPDYTPSDSNGDSSPIREDNEEDQLLRSRLQDLLAPLSDNEMTWEEIYAQLAKAQQRYGRGL